VLVAAVRDVVFMLDWSDVLVQCMDIGPVLLVIQYDGETAVRTPLRLVMPPNGGREVHLERARAVS
jgi:hypothetical protein